MGGKASEARAETTDRTAAAGEREGPAAALTDAAEDTCAGFEDQPVARRLELNGDAAGPDDETEVGHGRVRTAAVDPDRTGNRPRAAVDDRPVRQEDAVAGGARRPAVAWAASAR